MKTIHKFPLSEASSVIEVYMPMGADIAHIGVDASGEICIWALVETTLKHEKKVFRIVGTGWEVTPEMSAYIGTVVRGEFVWHVFGERRD